jgi:hypothetical protein
LIAVPVAIAYGALALGDGGYSLQVTSGATVAVWWAVVIGLVLGAWPRSRVPAFALATGACLVALTAWTALSMVWASDQGAAFSEAVRAAGYLGLFALLLVASPRASAQSWLAGLAIGVTFIAALALLSRLEPSFGGGHAVGQFLPSAKGRLSYPIGYWNGLAAVMAAGAAVLVWLGGHGPNRIARAAAVAALPVLALVVYFTSSRGGIVAGAVGLAVLLALGPARPRMLGGLALGAIGAAILVAVASQEQSLTSDLGTSTALAEGDRTLALTVVVVILVGLGRWLLDARIRRLSIPRVVTRATLAVIALAIVVAIPLSDPAKRWDEFKSVSNQETRVGYVTTHLTTGAGSGRYQYWSAALDAFEAQPFHGIGAGGYEAWWDEHGTLARPIKDAHSFFLETMAELGIVGLLLALAFLGTALVSGIKRRPLRSPNGALGATVAVFATGVVAAAIDWTWELPASFGLVVFAMALMSGPATETASVVERVAPDGLATSKRRPRFGLGIASLLLAWACIWAAGLLFLAEVNLHNSQEAARAGDLDGARSAAEEAITLEPWSAEPRLQLALVKEEEGDLEGANAALSEAIDRAPNDWQLWFVRARIEVELGDVPAGSDALDRARELNPRAPFLASDSDGP